MKKILLLAFVLFSFATFTQAKTLKGNVSLNWDILSQNEITEDINNIKKEIFSNDIIYKYDKAEFKQSIQPFLKNKDNKEDLELAKNGGADLNNKIVVPFYYKNMLLAYGVIYKNNMKRCYYYTPFGGLFSIETFDKNYGDYPVISYQYKKDGKMLATVYNKTKDDQYMYKANGKFIGRWFNENYYNEYGKVIMTRDLPKF